MQLAHSHQNLLGPLRINVEAYIPLDNPFRYEGTAGPWDANELQRVFAQASVIEVGSVNDQRSPLFAMNLGATTSPVINTVGTFPVVHPGSGEAWTLKVAKAGVLNRKDDILEGGKKAHNRKWKPWSVVLTGSQLLLFRDSSWAANLLARYVTPDGHVIFPEASVCKPDEVWSVKDAVAVFDSTYSKACKPSSCHVAVNNDLIQHENTFRFIMAGSRQILLQATNENELNEWMSRINYASAFKSAGIQMRGLGMSSKDVELTGVAAATSLLHDMQERDSSIGDPSAWDGDAHNELMDMLSGGFPAVPRHSPARRITVVASQDVVDLEVPRGSEPEGFKATFDRVKAELSAGRWFEERSASHSIEDAETTSPSISPCSASEKSLFPSRSEIIRTKVRDIESNIQEAETQLEENLCFARNIATLTPFQKSTRDRLENAVRNVSKKISEVRLEMTKLVCHRDVLSKDVKAAEMDWCRAKNMALKAATETLRSEGQCVVPRMTHSLHDNAADESFALQLTPRTTESGVSESSICESFHSALDFGPEWPSLSDELVPCSFFSTTVSSSGSSLSFPVIDAEAMSSGRNSEEHVGQEKMYSGDEEAEEWNKTRCAQRVSLVRLPSSFCMPTLLEIQSSRRT